jgi:hypothetical protein
MNGSAEPHAALKAPTTHLPDASQELLLRAALADGDAAQVAWETWAARTRWESEPIDAASTRVLPLVYASLAQQLPPAADLPKLKVLYRRTWYENNRLLQRAKPAIRALLDAGHRVMLLKGAALVLRHYGDRGARPMGDVDLLVPDGEADAALDELDRLGWVSGEPGRTARDVLTRHHAVNLVHESGGRVDLHRRFLADSPQGADGPLWDRAEPVAIDELRLLAPSAADELLLACVHGWQWNVVPSIRWIHDAVVIARRMRGEDWAWLECEARRRQVSFRLSRALRVVHDRFAAPVPVDLLARIEAGPFASFEAAEERNHTSAPGLAPGFPRAYFALAREIGPPDGPRWWLQCAQRFWFVRNPPSGAQLAPWLARWVTQRFRSTAAARDESSSARRHTSTSDPGSPPRA